jgi:hypothetical protein
VERRKSVGFLMALKVDRTCSGLREAIFLAGRHVQCQKQFSDNSGIEYLRRVTVESYKTHIHHLSVFEICIQVDVASVGAVECLSNYKKVSIYAT